MDYDFSRQRIRGRTRQSRFAPDIREDDTKFKVQRGNFVVVPIPISNPILDTGLVVGAAYFYGQSEEEAKVQPASLTAAGALYTSNYSRAAAIVQQNYWRGNKRRFTGAGEAGSTYSGLHDNVTIPSYGLGIRFSVLPAKRINLLVDFARSRDSDAVYISVGEAF